MTDHTTSQRIPLNCIEKSLLDIVCIKMLNIGLNALPHPLLQLLGLCFLIVQAVICLLHVQGLEKWAVMILCSSASHLYEVIA